MKKPSVPEVLPLVRALYAMPDGGDSSARAEMRLPAAMPFIFNALNSIKSFTSHFRFSPFALIF